MSNYFSVGEAIQRFQSQYSKGVQSRSSRLTSRHIYSCLKTGRSVVLRQRANKGQYISSYNYQVLPCVELVEAPIHECPCVPTSTCRILRTKYKIPKLISDLNKGLIQSVTALDGILRFDEDKFENIKYSGDNKFTATKALFYIRDGYMGIVNKKALRGLTITGLFDDPITAWQFPSICPPCEDCGCEDIMDLEFPIDGDLVNTMNQLAYNELIVLFKQMDEDKSGNASDDADPSRGGAMVHQPSNQQQQE